VTTQLLGSVPSSMKMKLGLVPHARPTRMPPLANFLKVACIGAGLPATNGRRLFQIPSPMSLLGLTLALFTLPLLKSGPHPLPIVRATRCLGSTMVEPRRWIPRRLGTLFATIRLGCLLTLGQSERSSTCMSAVGACARSAAKTRLA
jgi:hypothetical protein